MHGYVQTLVEISLHAGFGHGKDPCRLHKNTFYYIVTQAYDEPIEYIVSMNWQPHVTVAAVIEREHKFLLVQERVDEHTVFNQPAGHWEQGETLIEAVRRETLEETGWEFYPDALVGVYCWKHPHKDETYLRFTLCGQCSEERISDELDAGILQACWCSADSILSLPEHKLRSTMVTHSLQDYLDGKRYGLDLIRTIHQHW